VPTRVVARSQASGLLACRGSCSPLTHLRHGCKERRPRTPPVMIKAASATTYEEHLLRTLGRAGPHTSPNIARPERQCQGTGQLGACQAPRFSTKRSGRSNTAGSRRPAAGVARTSGSTSRSAGAQLYTQLEKLSACGNTCPTVPGDLEVSEAPPSTP
jgi:hypothetical protein